MKKIVYTFLFALGICSQTNAQDISKNAIGVRLGDNHGFGGEISYQRKFSDENRLEADLGFRNRDNFSAFKLTALYQWVGEIDNGFNWYLGAGGGVGSWKIDGKYGDGSGSFLFAAGDVGVEYNFEGVPFQISLDYRPELYFSNDYGKGLQNDIALGIRYKFD
ncbi:hypothetical protein [Flavobacterium sp.]|uniref:hypothetical protein n=1 Tax=Flavobacterium sp. TaxID=239 RepID=UPI003D09FABC